jgi:hypothetical protein
VPEFTAVKNVTSPENAAAVVFYSPWRFFFSAFPHTPQ